MLRIYKMPNGRTYQFNDGEQPADAILVERLAEQPETPEKRASKVASRKRAAKTKKAEEV
ncbi:MAG: hypothetical protein IKF14_05000 [Atopobiaceae bacterium]|nr:hypothetical protein [Atopobiaceae bacterium]